ncbi:MAG: hypothetical protein IKJ56_09720, partial [Bacteroidales bacterium]|nr:hypothetical protein [Bacteroidales bacterium]
MSPFKRRSHSNPETGVAHRNGAAIKAQKRAKPIQTAKRETASAIKRRSHSNGFSHSNQKNFSKKIFFQGNLFQFFSLYLCLILNFIGMKKSFLVLYLLFA